MVFSSVVFIGLFLPIVLCLYFVVQNRSARNIVLLLASLFFYAWGEPVWIAAMIILTFIDFLIAKWVEKKSSKFVIFLAVVLNLSVLFVVKYYDFFVSSINSAIKSNIPLLHISMPIGISFFTFQALTYVVDVYRGDAKAQKNYGNLLLYISMFPQLIAGPIVRYSDIDEQIQNRTETRQGFIDGMFRFSVGLGKKVFFANYAGNTATALLGDNFNGISTKALWIGIVMFSLQLYFDFSGYSDMAIGLGKVFGFDYKENFNYPFIASSIQDFWRRWHISLTSFFRDYVYIPMGGNRKHQFFNVLTIWMLTGLWHGANWNYVIWGLFFAILLTVEKYLKTKCKLDISKVPGAGNVLVLIIIVYSMSLFYFNDLSQMAEASKIMLGMGENISLSLVEQTIIYKYLWIMLPMILGATPIPAKICNKAFKQETTLGNIARGVFFISILIVSFGMIVNQTYNPFLYFRF